MTMGENIDLVLRELELPSLSREAVLSLQSPF